MIYLGLIHFDHEPGGVDNLKKVLENFTDAHPVIFKKDHLTLVYGKLSSQQDMDDVWKNKHSICLGRIFDKKSHESLQKGTFKTLSSRNTNEVLEKIWGKYVFFNCPKFLSHIEVVIDSTGQLPFFYYTYPNGNVLFASDIDILYRSLNRKPEYNLDYLCSYLVFGNSSSIQTPFKDIFELPPACSLTISRNNLDIAPFWGPLKSYEDKDKQPNDAASVITSSLKAWIEPYKNICVSLSGGLDSSSLIYCLKDVIRPDQNLKALNYFHSQIKSSNELSHARQVCEETNVELIEIDLINTLPFDSSQRKHALKPNKPFPGLISLRLEEIIYDQLSTEGAFTFISGHGSDHIFMRPPTKKCLIDYVFEKGIKGAQEKLDELTHFYRDSSFSIIKENLKALSSYILGFKPKKGSIEFQLKSLPKWLSKNVINNTDSMTSHPIYDVLPTRILPGKFNQIDAVYEGFNSIHVEILNQADPTFYPYLYQPVVDYALSIPTYSLFDKGYDRYPLRKSITDHFKTQQVWRRDKSETTGIFQLGVKKNIDKIKDLCLNGHFASEGLVDPKGLQDTINLIGNGDVKNLWPLIHLTSLEMFIKQWEKKVL